MGYILGLFLILGVIFYSAGNFGIDIPMNIVGDGISNLKSKLYSTVFPRSDREILIDNLQSNSNLLDKFFSDTAPKLLESKNISDKDKDDIRQAVAKFSDTKKSIEIVKSLGTNDKGIVQKLVDKILNNDVSLDPEATYVPNTCHLECN